MSLNIDRYHDKAASVSRGQGDFFRLIDGKNVVRIFTFEHKVTKRDFTVGNYHKGAPNTPKVGKMATELDRECAVHFMDEGGPSNCSRETDCEQCAESAEYSASSRKADQEIGRKMSARRQYNLNLVDMNDPSGGMKVAAFPPSVYSEILAALTSGEYEPEELFGSEGRDFIILRDTKKPPSEMYRVQLRDAKKSKPLDESLEAEVTDLFDMKTLDPGARSGDDKSKKEKEEDEDEDEEEEEEDTKAAKAKKAKAAKAKKAKAKKEEEEEEDDDEFEDDDEDDDEDEDEDSDDPVQEHADGTKVTFTNDGDKFTGVVVSWTDGTYEVETEDDMWELEATDFKVVAKRAGKKKAAKRGKK